MTKNSHSLLAILLILLVATSGCISSYGNLPYKEWHSAQTGKAALRYPSIRWKRLKLIEIGMRKTKIEEIVGAKLVFEPRNQYAILLSETPDRLPVEVALQFTEDILEDVSYRKP